jgi:hypothetical protein
LRKSVSERLHRIKGRHRKRLLIGTVLTAFAAAMVIGPPASAHHSRVVLGDSVVRAVGDDHQHGSATGHLRASKRNVQLVGKLKLTNFEGDISDVSALQTSDGRWFAYLGDWAANCATGGVHVVNFTNPAKPVSAGFLDSGGSGYVTEGVHALRIDTAAFTGDILVVSNEWCSASNNPNNLPGGITLWDITEPTAPKQLVRGFGDTDLFKNRANESHSAIAWDAGPNAYVAAVDNDEAFDDVDIFNITNPRKPVKVSETGLFDLSKPAPNTRWPGAEFEAFGQEPTNHDMDVIRKPDGTWHLMLSYWDAGWVDLDVTNPANPTFVEDSTYAACDQVVQGATGQCLQPEGNAHQGEWNGDGSLFIGTDEDFGPTRAKCSSGGAVIGCTEFGWTDLVPLADRNPANFSGTTVFGGSGCTEDVDPANGTSDRTDAVNNLSKASTGVDAIVFVRGTCFFSDKVQTGIDAGYDMVIQINSHAATADGQIPNGFFAGGQGSAITPDVASSIMIGHANGHQLFNDPPAFSGTDIAFGAKGNTLNAEGGTLDGWGYVRLLDSNPAGGFTEIDQLTIPETIDPAFNQGFGDLTVHEVEVPRGDPNEGGPAPDDGKLAYFSWYSGGFRVAQFDATGIEEVGHHIDRGGNNHWGVALAKDQKGNRIVLASDRDFGLYIYRYTGPMP